MFSTIADLGLFDDPSENEQDSSPDVFDKLWDKVTQLWSHFLLEISYAIIKQDLFIPYELFLTTG